MYLQFYVMSYFCRNVATLLNNFFSIKHNAYFNLNKEWTLFRVPYIRFKLAKRYKLMYILYFSSTT